MLIAAAPPRDRRVPPLFVLIEREDPRSGSSRHVLRLPRT
jgi:hypothetical protein